MRLGLECVPVRLVEVKWSPSKEGVECGVVFDGLVKFIVEVCDSTYFDHVSRGHDFRGLDYINDLTDYMEK